MVSIKTDCKILYVEDEFITRFEVMNMLNDRYTSVFTAKNGIAGLQIFEDNDIDIVITDIKMPEMDGIEMCSKIRDINKTVVIIVVSAFEKEFFKMDNLNISEFIVKPITKFSLYNIIDKYYNEHHR